MAKWSPVGLIYSFGGKGNFKSDRVRLIDGMGVCASFNLDYTETRVICPYYNYKIKSKMMLKIIQGPQNKLLYSMNISISIKKVSPALIQAHKKYANFKPLLYLILTLILFYNMVCFSIILGYRLDSNPKERLCFANLKGSN